MAENTKPGWISLLIVAGLTALAVSYCTASGDGHSRSGDRAERMCEDDGYAWIMAGNFVKRRLHAPSTAKFPHKPQFYEYHGDCKHTVVGTFEAKNPMGVMLRSNFSATMIYLKDEDKWRAENLQIF